MEGESTCDGNDPLEKGRARDRGAPFQRVKDHGGVGNLEVYRIR